MRWLPAVETLGSVTVIASDKTGTLTEGRMVVQHLWTPTGRAEVTGRGYGTSGAIEPAGGTAALDDLLRDLVLCNDAHLAGPVEGEWMIVGDPMEAALLVAAAKGRVGTADVRASWERAEEVPFDSERQRMTTLDRWVGAPRGGEGRGPLGGTRGGPWLVVCKGAPEVVLDLVAGRVRSAWTRWTVAAATRWTRRAAAPARGAGVPRDRGRPGVVRPAAGVRRTRARAVARRARRDLRPRA